MVGHGYGEYPFGVIRSDAAGSDIIGDIVVFPVFQTERGRGDIGISVYGEISPWDETVMAIFPDTLFGGVQHFFFFYFSVVVTQDNENPGIGTAQGVFDLYELGNQVLVDKVFEGDFVTAAQCGVGGGEDIAADEQCRGFFTTDAFE